MIFKELFAIRKAISRAVTSKQIHTSSSLCNSVKKSPLFILRSKTGLAYSLCREALDKHDNDVDKASAWLEAQALAHGLQKASKVKDRSAREGLLGMSIHPNNKIISILELNCETDFVAKNQIFTDFAIDITEQIAGTVKTSEKHEEQVNYNHMEVLTPSKNDLDNVDTRIPPVISKLGENIKVTCAKHYRILNPDEFLFGQIHAQSGQKETSHGLITVGRYGAMVALKRLCETTSLEHLTPIGNRLCQHVIGFSPTYIELPDEIKKQLEEIEKQRREEIIKKQELDSLEKEEEDPCDSDDEFDQTIDRDEWPSMLDQTIIMSEEGESVRSFCKRQEIEISYFKRMECGSRD